MIPAKVKDLIPQAASEIGIPEEDMANMYSFYIKENKKAMSKLQHLFFVFRGLGVMSIKGWQLSQEIEEKERKISRTFNPENIAALQEEVAILKSALEKWNAHKALQKDHSKKKKQYYDNKKAINNEPDRET